jgi:hypothetical protein
VDVRQIGVATVDEVPALDRRLAWHGGLGLSWRRVSRPRSRLG